MNKYAIKNFYNIDGVPLYAVEIRHTAAAVLGASLWTTTPPTKPRNIIK